MASSSGQIADDAKSVKKRFDEQVAAIEAVGLMPDVEKARLAEEYLDKRRQMDKLRAEYDEARKRERIDYAQQAFGVADLVRAGSDPMTHMVSYRDAQDRVAGVGREKLGRLLAEAIDTGDTLLARACATRAFRSGWSDVVKVYEDHMPGWTETAQEARQQQQNEGMAAALRFRLRKPTQISTLGESQMKALVDKVDHELEQRDKPKWKYF